MTSLKKDGVLISADGSLYIGMTKISYETISLHNLINSKNPGCLGNGNISRFVIGRGIIELHGPNAEESSGNTLLENSAYRITALSAYGHKVSLSEPIKCFSLLFFEADVHFVYRFPAGVDRYITWIFTPGGTYERDERRFSRGYLDDPNENESDYVCSVIDY